MLSWTRAVPMNDTCFGNCTRSSRFHHLWWYFRESQFSNLGLHWRVITLHQISRCSVLSDAMYLQILTGDGVSSIDQNSDFSYNHLYWLTMVRVHYLLQSSHIPHVPQYCRPSTEKVTFRWLTTLLEPVIPLTHLGPVYGLFSIYNLKCLQCVCSWFSQLVAKLYLA
jgi:hypothetical protein